MKTYHHLNLKINNIMENLKTIVDINLPIKPKVEEVRCCTCCIISKNTDVSNKKCCECCTNITKIIKHKYLENNINKKSKCFGRWISY